MLLEPNWLDWNGNELEHKLEHKLEIEDMKHSNIIVVNEKSS